MGFGSRRSLIRSRRPARTPLEATAKFLDALRHPLSGSKAPPGKTGPPPASGKPVVKREALAQGKPLAKPEDLPKDKVAVPGKPIELVPADQNGADLSANAEPGDTLAIRGRPATVAGHSRRGGLLVTPGPTPAPADLTDRSNRPKGDRPDHGPADETDMEAREDA